MTMPDINLLIIGEAIAELPKEHIANLINLLVIIILFQAFKIRRCTIRDIAHKINETDEIKKIDDIVEEMSKIKNPFKKDNEE